MDAFAPKEIPVGRHRKALGQMEVDKRMEVDKVRGTYQGNLPEIGALGKEHVEGLEGAGARVVVPTGDVRFQPKTRTEADC
jgi:hypothetical protein